MTETRTITFVIDGITASAPEGTLIIEAAAMAGIMIPRFCYHKLLRPYGGCRMCLVIINKTSAKNPFANPRPQAACMVPVEEGMEIDTRSDVLKNIRKGILEFTLLNHPLDCPVCDKGGECDLQDLTFMYGPADSRLKECKMFRPHHNLSSLIVLDYNRCILCKRCVRWTDEIADDDRLVYHERGPWSAVGTFNDNPFMSRFGGMTIELCPVGALLSNVFRFKSRVWEVTSIPSVCPQCSNGCSHIGQIRHGIIHRLISKENPEINGPFYCDRGRFAHDYIDNPIRIITPLKWDTDHFKPVTWDEAAQTFADKFKIAVKQWGLRSVAACAHPGQPLESLWAFRRLFRDIIGTPRIEHGPAPIALDPDDIPAIFTRLAPLPDILKSKNIVLWDSDPFDETPAFGLQLKLAWGRNEIDGVSVSPIPSCLGKHGFDERITPPHRNKGILAAIVTGLASKVKNLPSGLQSSIESARKASTWLREHYADTAQAVMSSLLQPDSVLIIGPSTLRSRPAEVSILLLIADLAERVKGSTRKILPVTRHANSVSALLLGLRTELLQGAMPGSIGFTGESVLDWPKDIEKGKLKAVFVQNDSLIDSIGLDDIETFKSLEFLAVATDFMSPLAQQADLIIPALSPYENTGTLVSFDGRISRMEKLAEHPNGAWPMERFYSEVARILGAELHIERSELRKEIAEGIPAFKSLLSGPGGYIEMTIHDDFRLGELKHTFDLPEPPAKSHFGVIIAEPVFQHDTLGKHMPNVAGMPEEFACGMNKEDAKKLDLSDGDRVTLIGETGKLKSRLKFVKTPPGYVLLYSGFSDYPLGELGLVKNSDARITVEKSEGAPVE